VLACPPDAAPSAVGNFLSKKRNDPRPQHGEYTRDRKRASGCRPRAPSSVLSTSASSSSRRRAGGPRGERCHCAQRRHDGRENGATTPGLSGRAALTARPASQTVADAARCRCSRPPLLGPRAARRWTRRLVHSPARAPAARSDRPARRWLRRSSLAVLKTAGGRKVARGFDSHPRRSAQAKAFEQAFPIGSSPPSPRAARPPNGT
jgi:hypothetical protein